MVPPYRSATDEAFERMFERDKDELRALGVPVQVAGTDAFFDDEPGYRIRQEEFALPGIDLTADEAAVVGLATRVWQHAGLAAATSDALAKLAAGGVSVDRSRLDLAPVVVTDDDPHFEAFWQASLDRVRVSFGYRRRGSAEPATRTLEPWGVVSFSGRWYVVGRDVDRGEERMFRLSRVQGPVRRSGRGGAFSVPAGTDLRELTRRLAPGPATQQATVLVRAGTCLALRRAAAVVGEGVGEGVTGPDPSSDWDRLQVEFSSPDMLADELLALGADVYVEDPPAVRDAVVSRLAAVVGSA
ncbi:WYL domain-containing protein [Nocardioides sp. MJB4]|uniref:WYL domain-containing protein n=2 Tax=Nocardioides donggukensis TaxID=2774019 RepID=A0A927K366_9ACTN|nr:WYL domain-containing protein [Nocardioides donggukensis]